MLATTHCEPNRTAHSVRIPGDSTAAVFTPTLSAPARNACATSFGRANPAPNRQGNEYPFGRPSREVEKCRAFFGACRDVEIHDLIRAIGLVALGEDHRITDVAQRLELDAFDDAIALYVETDDESARHH